MRPRRTIAPLSAVIGMVAVLALPAPAAARGGDYLLEGGSEAARTQVRRALDASAFDWGIVPARVVIHVGPGFPNRSTPGHIWLDERLLAAGRFSWAVVQDEYAHQVDFFLLDDDRRRSLAEKLGTSFWSRGEAPGLGHSEYGAERFASTLVWAYWPSRHNAYRPRSPRDEAGALAPSGFRSLLASLLPAAPR